MGVTMAGWGGALAQSTAPEASGGKAESGGRGRDARKGRDGGRAQWRAQDQGRPSVAAAYRRRARPRGRRMPRARRLDDPPACARRRGAHCLDPEAYRAAIARICEESATGWCCRSPAIAWPFARASRGRPSSKTNPEAVSLALRELAPEAADERPLATSSAAQADAGLAAVCPLSAAEAGGLGRC